MDTNITNKAQALKFLQKEVSTTNVIPMSSVEIAKQFFSDSELRRLNIKPPIIINSCFCRKRPELELPAE
jgi:hypothetical protein